MRLDPVPRVAGAGAGAKDKRPVAGLREKQFTRCLTQGARRESAGVGKLSCKFGETRLRDVQMGQNPFVALVEPDLPITFLAPARGRGLRDLLRGMVLQVFVRRDKLEDLLVVVRLPHEVI